VLPCFVDRRPQRGAGRRVRAGFNRRRQAGEQPSRQPILESASLGIARGSPVFRVQPAPWTVSAGFGPRRAAIFVWVAGHLAPAWANRGHFFGCCAFPAGRVDCAGNGPCVGLSGLAGDKASDRFGHLAADAVGGLLPGRFQPIFPRSRITVFGVGVLFEHFATPPGRRSR
jgi:hypothetical protein